MGAMSGPSDPNLGRVLKGTYRIERLLGRGGMGAVYEARHTKISKRFAVKLLLPELDLTTTLRERFFREAEACSRIDHENVVDIIDFDEAPEGELFMVMEILEGEDLARRLRSGLAVPPEALTRWFVEICDAVAAAHQLGIVHRDLKPANIFLQRRGEREIVKVLDFGLAKFRAEAGLTTSGALMGTPCYMAPEQIEGEGDAVGPAADIFALGCILYELLVGQVAFSGRSIAQIAYQIVHGRRPALPPDRHAGLQPLLDACLSQDPAERPADALALRARFLELVSGMPELPMPAIGAGGARLSMGLPSAGDRADSAAPEAARAGAASGGSAGSSVGELETLVHDSAAADPGLEPTVAAVTPDLRATRPLGRRPGAELPRGELGGEPFDPRGAGEAWGGTAAATAAPRTLPGGGEPSLPSSPSAGEDSEPPPDAAQYTTLGRLRRRRGLVVLGIALALLAIAAVVLLPRFTRRREARRTHRPSAAPLPLWARSVAPDAQPALRQLERPDTWYGQRPRAWTELAEVLEKAHQGTDLAPGPLQSLQTRMYLARAIEHLLAGRPERAVEMIGQAVRKAEGAGEPAARTLAALGAAWIWLHRDAPDEARDRLREVPTSSGHGLALRAAADLLIGDVATALSGARRATTLAPGDPMPWLVLSQASSARGDLLEAERAAAEALALAPEWPAARARLGTLLGGVAARRAEARALCQTRPEDAALYRDTLAGCRARLRLAQVADAPDRFHRGRALQGLSPPLEASGLRAGAPFLLGAEDVPAALLRRLAQATAGTAARPASARGLRIGAAVALRERRLPEAESILRTAAGTARWPHRVRVLEGELAAARGDLGEAIRRYEEANRAALRSGVGTAPPGRGRRTPAGACDRAAPPPSEHRLILRRLAALRRILGARGPSSGGRSTTSGSRPAGGAARPAGPPALGIPLWLGALAAAAGEELHR